MSTARACESADRDIAIRLREVHRPAHGTDAACSGRSGRSRGRRRGFAADDPPDVRQGSRRRRVRPDGAREVRGLGEGIRRTEDRRGRCRARRADLRLPPASGRLTASSSTRRLTGPAAVAGRLRGAFADGQIAEHGGEFIDTGHDAMRGLVRRARLPAGRPASRRAEGHGDPRLLRRQALHATSRWRRTSRSRGRRSTRT